MARITRKSVGKSEQYLSHRETAKELGEGADCAVRAVSVACSRPYEEVLEVMTRMGRKPRGATETAVIRDTIISMGYNPANLEWKGISDKIESYPGNHKNKKYVTTHQPDRFPEVWKDGKTYLFFVRGHVLCVKDGVNHDWTRGRSLKVFMIWEIK